MLINQLPQTEPVENEIMNINQLADQPESEQPQDVQQVQTADQSVQEQERIQARNFKALRDERDEALKLVKSYQQQQQQNLEIAPDDIAEGKHISHINDKISKLQEQLTESQLKVTYPDFDTVVNADSLKQLQQEYPHLAQSIHSTTDLYTKAVSAYTLIKKFGISTQELQQNKKLVDQNYSKPRSMASISPQQGDSPLSKANAFANGLTTDLQKQLWKETKEAMKNF